jgi:hypothetical protein
LPGASRGAVTSRARRTPLPLRLKLVSGDALGERDDRTIITGEQLSNFAVLINMAVSKSLDGRCGSATVTDATYPHRFAACIAHVGWLSEAKPINCRSEEMDFARAQPIRRALAERGNVRSRFVLLRQFNKHSGGYRRARAPQLHGEGTSHAGGRYSAAPRKVMAMPLFFWLPFIIWDGMLHMNAEKRQRKD